jgi:hypothetical protein
MANVNRTSIEFVVRPKEDLYLEGTLRRLPRVTKGNNDGGEVNYSIPYLLALL